MYQWFVFVHLAGVFGLLASHGVSMGVMFRLRTERDPARVESLLQVSAQALAPFYVSLLVLLGGGVVAAFLGDLWSYGWIWGSIVVLLVIMIAMYAMARPYYQRVRFISRAMAEGSEAVTPEQFDSILRSGRPWSVAVVGVLGLAVILYFMLFKPTLGLAPEADAGTEAAGAAVRLTAEELSFSTERLTAPAQEPFRIVLDNQASVPHNVSVYDDGTALARGEVVAGPATVSTTVPALDPGSYRFTCDVHPDQMTGTLEVA